MSTICLAAQRSFNSGEAVYFSWRLPDMRKVLLQTLLWLLTVVTCVVGGVYAHIYWHCQHPVAQPKPVKVVNPDVQLSAMHYVYVSKPFPHPKPAPLPIPQTLPPAQNDDAINQDSDWQQTPDGDLSEQALPGTQEQTPSLKERFMQALQEQQADYQQGKVAQPPTDETSDDNNALQNVGTSEQVATHKPDHASPEN